MMARRVELRLLAPEVVFAGETVEGELELVPRGRTTVDTVTMRVVGTNGCNNRAYNLAERIVHERLEQISRMSWTPGAIAEPTRLRVKFDLPRYAPTSHSLFGLAYAALTLQVYVAIPFRFDVEQAFVLHVRRRQQPFIPEPATRRHETDKHRLDVSISSARVTPGARLLGTCVIHGFADDAAHDVSLKLVARVAFLAGSGRERTARTQRLVMPEGTVGTPIPFDFVIPRDLATSVLTNTHTVSWSLRVRAGSAEVDMPIEIVDEPTTNTPPTAPIVGVPRVEPQMQQFAESAGWVYEREIVAGDPALGTLFPAVTRDAGSRKLVLAYSHRGKDGTFVVARASYPPLELGLDVAPTSWKQRFARDIESGVPAWDRAYFVEANEAVAARALLSEVVRVIPAELGTLVRWDDDEIVFERPEKTVDQALLAELADGLDVVVDAIDRCRMNARLVAGPYR